MPLTAIAVRLGTALLAEQQTSYRLVNKLLTSRDQSLGASQAYWEAAAAAHLRAANLTDSLELARRAFAEDEGVRQDITREVQLWTRATRQVAELYGYYPQVLLPCVRMRESIKQLLNKLQAHDGAGFVEARQQLAVEAGFAAAELAAVTDFMNLDVAFRDAGRAFVAQQLDACTGSLARAADLMLTQRSRELTNEEAQGINGLLNEYIRQTQAKDVALEKAGETFLRRNSPNFNADNAR